MYSSVTCVLRHKTLSSIREGSVSSNFVLPKRTVVDPCGPFMRPPPPYHRGGGPTYCSSAALVPGHRAVWGAAQRNGALLQLAHSQGSPFQKWLSPLFKKRPIAASEEREGSAGGGASTGRGRQPMWRPPHGDHATHLGKLRPISPFSSVMKNTKNTRYL